MLLYSVLAGVLFGLYFSLIGLGLNLVFGVMRIVNLAHGDFLMLGAFLAFWLFALFAVNPIPVLPIAFAVFVAVGLPLYYLLVPRLLKAKDPEMLSFILFFGLSQVIEAVTTIAFGTSERSIPGDQLGRAVAAVERVFIGHEVENGPVEIFGQSFPAAWVASGIASGCAVLLVYLYLYRTRLGYLTRAVMDNREEAIATGINVHRVSARRLRHRHRACGCRRRLRTFHARQHHPGDGSGGDRDVVCRHRHRLAWQSARHRAGRSNLRRLLHADAELLQLVGQSSALCPAHRDPVGAAQRPARTAGAPCLGLRGICC